MNIKAYLKEINITQSELADRINISRPTLDSYIKMYEAGQVIPRDRYEIIFHRLFSNNVPRKAFITKLESIERLFSRDERLGLSNMPAKSSDMVADILNTMSKDITEEDYSPEVYTFISMLLNNYRREKLFRVIAEYFVALNNEDTYQIREDQIPYFANIYATLDALRNKPLEYREEDYTAFVQRRKQVTETCKKAEIDAARLLKERIAIIMRNAQDKGLQLTADEIVQSL